MRTIAIVNQKGGCGKTTTAINLAAVYAARGLRTLLVDMDPQSHCACGLGVPEDSIEYDIGRALVAPPGEDLSQVIWEVSRNLDLAPSTMRLAGLEAPGGGLHQRADRDRRLASVLGELAPRYDRCLIDCPPTIGLLTFNALRASREALIPVETGFFSLRGAQKQWGTIQRVIERIGRPIGCHLVPTMHRFDDTVANDILSSLRREFAGQIIPVVIREHAELRAAASFGMPVLEYAKDSEALCDFDRLADWLEEHIPQPAVEIEVTAREALPLSRPSPDTPIDAFGGRAAEMAQRVRDLTRTVRGDAPQPLPPEPVRDLALRPTTGLHAALLAAAPTQTATATIDPPPIPTTTAAPFGVSVVGGEVRFAQPVSAGRVLAIAGDFNGWSPRATPLELDEASGAYAARVRIEPGSYHYCLVVDGHWGADPYNDDRSTNEHGEVSSRLVVSGSARTTP